MPGPMAVIATVVVIEWALSQDEVLEILPDWIPFGTVTEDVVEALEDWLVPWIKRTFTEIFGAVGVIGATIANQFDADVDPLMVSPLAIGEGTAEHNIKWRVVTPRGFQNPEDRGIMETLAQWDRISHTKRDTITRGWTRIPEWVSPIGKSSRTVYELNWHHAFSGWQTHTAGLHYRQSRFPNREPYMPEDWAHEARSIALN